jgi:hypothetical protein
MYEYILLFSVLIYYLVISQYSEISTQDFIKVKLFPIMLFSVIFLVILITYISYTFVTRTTKYKNYLKKCKKVSKDKFCHIQVIPLSIPSYLINDLLDLTETHGKRIEIPQKRQRCISLKHLQEYVPGIVDWYQILPNIVSQYIGEKVYITPLSQPNSLCLVVYDKAGDYIDWHFDTNHYNGRFFTLLLPVTFEDTCGNYQYRDPDEDTVTLKLKKGDALLFEGDKVFHRGKELCDNQFRVILSCTFTTSQEIPIEEWIFQNIKNVGIFGEV